MEIHRSEVPDKKEARYEAKIHLETYHATDRIYVSLLVHRPQRDIEQEVGTYWETLIISEKNSPGLLEKWLKTVTEEQK
jgi:hypothetical protein